MFKIIKNEAFAIIGEKHTERKLNITITRNKISSDTMSKAYNGTFYVLSCAEDVRLRAINISTDVQEDQSSFNCKFPNTSNGLIEAIKCRKALESILRWNEHDATEAYDMFQGEKNFIEIKKFKTGNELIIREKESVLVNGEIAYSTKTFVDEYLPNALKGTGFKVFNGLSTPLGHSKNIESATKRVHLHALINKSGFKVEIITPFGSVDFTSIEYGNILEEGLLSAEYIRNFIVNNLRCNTQETTMTIEV